MAASCRLLRAALFVLLLNRCLAWDNDELEIFDLVEEVNANFYDVLGVGQDASTPEIRKAYRKLSLQLHPDKNKAENAEEQFRQMVAIYEVLKDESKRQMYNRVLIDGLPDWRMPVFYYRRARKMGFVELFGLLALIVTIGQYLYGWAVYIEQRLTLEDMIDSRRKKERKKKNKASEEAEELEEAMASLPKPSIFNLWPFRLPGFLYWCVRSIPTMIVAIKEEIAERRRRKVEEEEVEEEEEDDNDFPKVARKPKRRKMEVPEYTGVEGDTGNAVSSSRQTLSGDEQTHATPKKKKGEWTEEELVMLAKAVNKFPGGTPKRWEKIADMIGRSVDEVCSRCKNMKGTYTMNLSASVQGDVLTNTNTKMVKKNQHISDIITTADSDSTSASTLTDTSQQDSAENIARRRHRPTKIPKTAERTLIPQAVPSKEADSSQKEQKQRGSEQNGNGGSKRTELEGGGTDGDTWTQNQQVIFEWALRHFPKSTDKRWDKIAEQIPGKTKEDCIIRFKYLAELVKKKKGETQIS
ncbi:dnaJ homolog subfamily C member 1-like [Littorina saxatilis]|uniref:DnaJ homolog subfamily C member 2 n=1 Tax=Littorina saxatilis TaxID=31220 RepID=A0AAN9BR76_9CAEN